MSGIHLNIDIFDGDFFGIFIFRIFRPGPRGVHREGVPGGQERLKKITI